MPKRKTNSENQSSETEGRPITKKLFRSETDRIVGGVAGGLGKYFNIDSTLIRLLFILITVFGGSGFLLYMVLWLVIPQYSDQGSNYEDLVRFNANEIKSRAESWAEEFRHRAPEVKTRPVFGIILLVLGTLFLLNNFGYFAFFRWDKWWPVILIAFGLLVVAREDKSGR